MTHARHKAQIEAVIHPESVIHSMVEFVDGATIAQASPPNMKGPISYAINWPDRLKSATPAMDWKQTHSWDFEPIKKEQQISGEMENEVASLIPIPGQNINNGSRIKYRKSKVQLWTWTKCWKQLHE